MRKEMAQDLFYLNTDWSGRFKNQRIIVFDDVMTTGATMNAIASLLKNHGAKPVSAWVVLRTLPKSDSFAI
jgi:predicted amidophosphoribosyltransferase